MKKIKKGSDFKIIINKVISNGMMRLINQKEEVCVKFMKFDRFVWYAMDFGSDLIVIATIEIVSAKIILHIKFNKPI